MEHPQTEPKIFFINKTNNPYTDGKVSFEDSTNAFCKIAWKITFGNSLQDNPTIFTDTWSTCVFVIILLDTFTRDFSSWQTHVRFFYPEWCENPRMVTHKLLRVLILQHQYPMITGPRRSESMDSRSCCLFMMQEFIKRRGSAFWVWTSKSSINKPPLLAAAVQACAPMTCM